MWGKRFLLEMEQFPHRLVQLSTAGWVIAELKKCHSTSYCRPSLCYRKITNTILFYREISRFSFDLDEIICFFYARSLFHIQKQFYTLFLKFSEFYS